MDLTLNSDQVAILDALDALVEKFSAADGAAAAGGGVTS